MRFSKWSLPAIAILTLAGCSRPQTAQTEAASPPEASATFLYTGDNGPGFWAELRADWKDCSSNVRQSPIDISDVTRDPSLKPPGLELLAAPTRLLNNGHTIKQQYSEGQGGTMRFGDKVYQLLEFHFHTLSEHTLQGKYFPMEMHVVFQDQASEDMAVIGVFFELGPENVFLAGFDDDLPVREGDEYNSPSRIDVGQGLTSTASYYSYDGSLTTPPCSPSVTWIVLKQPASMSAQQSEAFRSILGNDFRPLQQRNDRIIRATVE